MIGVQINITDNLQRVAAAADKAAFRNLAHAAASVRKTAIDSIVASNEPSPPGQPPHTRARVTKKGKQLRGQLQRAIVFHHDRQRQQAIVGPRFSIVGESGAAHEFGGAFRGDEYPSRSFMGPALEANTARFAESWAGSLAE